MSNTCCSLKFLWVWKIWFIHRKLWIDNLGICMFVLCIMYSQVRKIGRLTDFVVPDKKGKAASSDFSGKHYVWIDLIFNSIFLLLILYISVLYISTLKYGIFLKAFQFQSAFSNRKSVQCKFPNSIKKCLQQNVFSKNAFKKDNFVMLLLWLTPMITMWTIVLDVLKK